MKKLFSWKNLRKLALIGLGIIGGFALVSMIGVLPFVGTNLAVALSAISTGAALAGVATTGVAVATMGVKGLVNGIRWLVSKKYREQVRNNNKEKKQ